MDHGEEERINHAVTNLIELFTYVIRRDYDPDHSAPEDVSEQYAEKVIREALVRLASIDPGDPDQVEGLLSQ